MANRVSSKTCTACNSYVISRADEGDRGKSAIIVTYEYICVYALSMSDQTTRMALYPFDVSVVMQ